MQYRTLGNTGMEVSVIGLGCAQLGSASTDYAVSIVQRALELGINYFDTAALYGNDLMLSPVPSMNDSRLNAAIKEAPNAMTAGLRERAHNICYTLLQTELIN